MTRIIVFSELRLVNGPNPDFDNLIIILISCFGKIKISCYETSRSLCNYNDLCKQFIFKVCHFVSSLEQRTPHLIVDFFHSTISYKSI